jgi:hypothetical protein
MRFTLLLICAAFAVGCSSKFDPALQEQGVERASDALTICQEHKPAPVENLSVLLATPTTAGEVTTDARTKRQPEIAPWDALPPDHFVASCNYGTDPEGDVVTYLVDDAGRFSKVAGAGGPPL